MSALEADISAATESLDLEETADPEEEASFEEVSGFREDSSSESEAEVLAPESRQIEQESESDTPLEDVFLPVSTVENLDLETSSLPEDEPTLDLDTSDLDLPTVDLPHCLRQKQ